MRRIRKLQFVAVAAAAVNLVIPLHFLHAAGPERAVRELPPGAAVTRDAALGESGQLRGQLVDVNGQPLSGHAMAAVQTGQAPQQAVTDDTGHFSFTGIRPGMCQLYTTDSVTLCRCWAGTAAPPAALKELLVVAGDPTERGQKPIGELFCGPVLIGLIIAAAVIIPIAVHNSKKSAS